MSQALPRNRRSWAPLLGLLLAGCAHAPGAPPASLAVPEERYAQQLLERRCQGCHALPDPRSHSRERWVKGVEQMRSRFTLSAADWDTLLALVPGDSSAPTP